MKQKKQQKKNKSKVQGSEHQWLGRSDMIKSSKSCFPSHMLVVWLYQVIFETEHLESRPSAFNRVCQRLWAPMSGSNWKKHQDSKRVPQLSACGVSVSSKTWDKIFKVTARLKVQSTRKNWCVQGLNWNIKDQRIHNIIRILISNDINSLLIQRRVRCQTYSGLQL